jgi:hypothetical protein
MISGTISPAGDPCSPAPPQDTSSHLCAEFGLVLLGTMVGDDDLGEEVEYLEAIPSRRCQEARMDAS